MPFVYQLRVRRHGNSINTLFMNKLFKNIPTLINVTETVKTCRKHTAPELDRNLMQQGILGNVGGTDVYI